MRACITANNFSQGIAGTLEKDFGEAGGKRGAKGVAVAGRVFDRNEAMFTGKRDADGAAGFDQFVDGIGDLGAGATGSDFGCGQIAELQ